MISARNLLAVCLVPFALLARAAMADDLAATHYLLGYEIAGAWGGNDRVGLNPPGASVGYLKQSGPLAGLLLGQSFRNGATVVALEGELSVTGIGDSDRSGVYRSRTRMKAGAAARVRLGYTLGAMQPYIAAGLGVGWFDYRVAGGGASIAKSFQSPGYSLAFGWQRRVDDVWSYRLEYRFSSYRGVTLRSGGFSTKATPIDKSVRFALVRSF